MNDSDFRQFKGPFDSAMEPDSTFVERLQQRMASEAPRQTMPLQSPVSAPLPVGDMRQLAEPRRSHPFYIAAAVLVVFALAAASIVQLAPRVREEQYASRAVATLPVGAVSTPGPDVALTAEPVAGLESVSYYDAYGDNLIAVKYQPPTDVQRLVSYNLQSGEVQWERDASGMAHFVFGDDVVVAVSFNQTEPEAVNAFPEFKEMVGYDLDTGDMLWTRSLRDWKVEQGWETVVMVDDTLVLLRVGEIVGIDPGTGETMWQADYDMVSAEEDGWIQPPSLVARNGSLYLAQMRGSVEVFDLASGAKVHEFELPAAMQDVNPGAMQLFEVPAGLLVVADSYGRPDPLTTLYVIEPENGDLVWERSLEQTGLVDVAPDGSIAIALQIWETPPLIMRLLGQDGHSTSALTWISDDGEVLLETDWMQLPDMFSPLVSGNGNYICGTIEQFVCFDRAGTRYTLDIPIAFDAVWVGDTVLLLTDRGVRRVDLP